MAKAARGNGVRMFIYLTLLGAVVAVFANDGAALILTPIVLSVVRALKLDERMVLPFVMASGFIADTTSLPFVISNLVNIVSADYFHIGFLEYTANMFVPNLVSLGASMLVLYVFYRKLIPKPTICLRQRNRHQLFEISVCSVCLGMCSAVCLLVILRGADRYSSVHHRRRDCPCFLVAGEKKSASGDKASDQRSAVVHCVFSIGMYVVVYGLKNVGLTEILAAWIQQGLHMACLQERCLWACCRSAVLCDEQSADRFN